MGDKPECTACGAIRSDLVLRRIGRSLWYLCPNGYYQNCADGSKKLSLGASVRLQGDAARRFSVTGLVRGA